MNIQWLGTPEARIISIRKFRKYIDELPFDEAIRVTRDVWESGPKINVYQFDISNIDEWPTPWELFSKNSFCVHSQILGIFYTLLLSKHSDDHTIQLIILNNIIEGSVTDLVIDNCRLLNYSTDDITQVVDRETIEKKLGEI